MGLRALSLGRIHLQFLIGGSFRKWTFLILLLSGFLFLLHQSYSYQQPRRPVNDISFKPYIPASYADDGKFRWNQRLRHYPLESLTPVPGGLVKHLPTVQYLFATKESTADRDVRLYRREQVKKTFVKAWSSYQTRSWMYDEIRPISGTGTNTFGGWAASLVDALDTLWIMDLRDDFYKAVTAAVEIDFTLSSDRTVNIFETNIRYLGGLLGAYSVSGDERLLHKAVEVGEMLLVPFDTPNHMPITRWDWAKAKAGEKQEAGDSMLVSELGSFSLEFIYLSQLTGDARWYDAIDRITNLFDRQQNATKLPGMWPIMVNPKNEDLTYDNTFTLGGMSDSLYEYFPKAYALLGGLNPVYQKLYEDSTATAIKALFYRPMTPGGDDILMSGTTRTNSDGSSYVTDPEGQHLSCFVGGMLELGGRLFSNDSHIEIGRKITDGCIWAYKAMDRGIMPEIAHFVACDSKTSCAWDSARWHAAILEREGHASDEKNVEEIIHSRHLPQGYTHFDDKRYILRPEAIESVFISYRITGDNRYRDAAWAMFEAIRAVSETPYANAAIIDITTPRADGEAPKEDRMESFFLAETLKYFYLIFSEPDLISLDEFVLNTEAHPLRRPR